MGWRAASRSVRIEMSAIFDRACASSAPTAATKSCAAGGSSTLGRAGNGFSAGPFSRNACRTTPPRIPTANRASVAIARASFTADDLAAGDRQREGKELVYALRVAEIDGVDVDGVAAHAPAADVRQREWLDRGGRAAGVRSLQLRRTLRDALVRSDTHDRVGVTLQIPQHVRVRDRRLTARAAQA